VSAVDELATLTVRVLATPQDTSRGEIERTSRPRFPTRQAGDEPAESHVQDYADEEENEQVPRDPIRARPRVDPVLGTAGYSRERDDCRDDERALHRATPIADSARS
jgi:hypothetical protein